MSFDFRGATVDTPAVSFVDRPRGLWGHLGVLKTEEVEDRRKQGQYFDGKI